MSFANTLGSLQFPFPVGSIIAYAGNSIPIEAGMLVCDGSLYSVNEYPALFNEIGYIYGGNDASFNVPDLVTNPYIQGGTVSGELKPSSITLNTNGTLLEANLPSLTAGNFALSTSSWSATSQCIIDGIPVNQSYIVYPNTPFAPCGGPGNLFAWCFGGTSGNAFYSTPSLSAQGTVDDYVNTYWQQNIGGTAPSSASSYYDPDPVAEFGITGGDVVYTNSSVQPFTIDTTLSVDVNPTSLEIIYLIKAKYAYPQFTQTPNAFIPIPSNEDDASGNPIPPYFNTWN